MKGKWANILGILSVLVIAFPSYAHAQGEYGDSIAILLISILITFVVFLILREVVCWYWKINETLSVLKEIRDLLKGNTPPESKEVHVEFSKEIKENPDGTFTVMGRTFKDIKDAKALLDFLG